MFFSADYCFHLIRFVLTAFHLFVWLLLHFNCIRVRVALECYVFFRRLLLSFDLICFDCISFVCLATASLDLHSGKGSAEHIFILRQIFRHICFTLF